MTPPSEVSDSLDQKSQRFNFLTELYTEGAAAKIIRVAQDMLENDVSVVDMFRNSGRMHDPIA
jgi:hypothetical protein